jgi:DNA polymerase-3 subunit alpha
MKNITFDCGCRYGMSDLENKMSINYDVTDINFDCSKTWDMISEGNTKGVFQLESRLGQSMAKKLKPENIEQLSALISIMRPGCLEAFRDGKSVSNHFIDKKNGLESIDYFNPNLEPILKTTYGEMVYQEQAMEIAKDIAGFNLQEADMLRKAIGKKKPEEMAKIKTKFIDGCKKQNRVSELEAEQIFGWIEKSQRYSFNKSHAISYAINAYLSAHAKAHFPIVFFLSYLRLAKDKINPQEEVLDLISNAKEMDINVFGPKLFLKNKDFTINNKRIYFGLTNIKGVGDSVFAKLETIIADIDLKKQTWTQTLFNILLEINSTAAKALMQCGALDYFKLTRNKMLHEYSMACELSKKELENVKNLVKLYPDMGFYDVISKFQTDYKIIKTRQPKIATIISQLKTPPFSLEDSPEWISDNERELLGISITCTKTDSYDSSYANTDCKHIKNFPTNKQFFVVAEVDSVNTILTKRGKNPGQEMCFLKISDGHGSIDCVVFPEEFAENKKILEAGRVLMFNGQKSAKDNTPIIKKCFVV